MDFGETVCLQRKSCSMAQNELALLIPKNNLLPNYPKQRRPNETLSVGRITVDAQEKD
jgi:hypothetical protein